MHYVYNNNTKIVYGWNDYCSYLYSNHNEQKHLDELIVTYTFHHLIKNHKIEDCIKLMKMIKPDSLKNQSLLHLAVKLNNIDAVEKILQEDICNIDQPRHGDLYTSLHLAVYNKNDEMVKLLLDYKANSNIKDAHTKTPLQYADQSGQT